MPASPAQFRDCRLFAMNYTHKKHCLKKQRRHLSISMSVPHVEFVNNWEMRVEPAKVSVEKLLTNWTCGKRKCSIGLQAFYSRAPTLNFPRRNQRICFDGIWYGVTKP